MSENNILRLIEKFEESLESTEKLTNMMLGLEGALKNLDTSINEVYELTKVEDLTNKSLSLLKVLKDIKNTQLEINEEYENLLNLKLYKDNIKEEILNIKESLINFDKNINSKVEDSTHEIKEDLNNYYKLFENKQEEIKKDILLSLEEILEANKK